MTAACSPLRIGINTLFLVPGDVGGVEPYFRNLLRELVHLDTRSDYILFTNRENDGTFATENAANVRDVRCPVRAMRRPARLAYEYALLPPQARRQRVDVLFSPNYTAPSRPYYASVAAILDMRHADLPETFSPAFRAVHARLVRRTAASAARILTLSDHAKRRIVAVYGVPPERVTVTHLAADPIYFAPVPGEEVARVRRRYGLHDPYILSVASLFPHKNLDTLLDAFTALRLTDHPPVQLALVGLQKSAAAALQARIRAGGLEKDVIVTGWVPEADLPALYRGAEVYVLPSRYEGFGLPVLEAMASGTPVITTTATSLPEVAGDAALLVDPDDRTGLVTALRRVLGDAALRAELVGRGRERATLFTWKKTAETTVGALHAAADRRSS
jgi:glycosyltransferase involved in cell wall biosynthesis